MANWGVKMSQREKKKAERRGERSISMGKGKRSRERDANAEIARAAEYRRKRSLAETFGSVTELFTRYRGVRR